MNNDQVTPRPQKTIPTSKDSGGVLALYFPLIPEKMNKAKNFGAAKKPTTKLKTPNPLLTQDGVGWNAFGLLLDEEYSSISDLSYEYAKSIYKHLKKTRKEPKNEMSFLIKLRADVSFICEELDGVPTLYIDGIKLYPNGHEGGKYRLDFWESATSIMEFRDIGYQECIRFLEDAVKEARHEFQAKLKAEAA